MVLAVTTALALHGLPLAWFLWAPAARLRPPPPEVVFEVTLAEMPRPAPSPVKAVKPVGPEQDKAEAPHDPVKREIKPRQTSPLSPVPAPSPAEVRPLPPAPEPKPEATRPPARTAPPTPVASGNPSWRDRLVLHLEAHKIYPADARFRRQQGVVWVRFTMDRSGKVRSRRIERGSGIPALDREALQLLGRAQPLPAPPDEVVGDPLELTVPIEFRMP